MYDNSHYKDMSLQQVTPENTFWEHKHVREQALMFRGRMPG